MKVIVPPIKSQGIKTKLIPWIMSLLPSKTGRWIEPFFGTGVVAFNAQFQEAILADVNPHIIEFYRSLQNRTITPQTAKKYLEIEGDELRRASNDGYDHFNAVKNRFNSRFQPLDFLFLSRSGFNGMMRFNKSGKWNIPFCKKPNRFSKSYITKICNQIEVIQQIITEDWQFLESDFRNIIPMAGPEDIIYCDPPYFGRYVDYYNGWREEDERDLWRLLSETPAKFILSTWHHNDHRPNEMINRYWSKFNVITRDHFYHSGGKIENRRSIVEALVFNFQSDLRSHNHGLVEKSEQMALDYERSGA